MQLGIRLHDVENGTLEHRLKVAAGQGFTCAHIALGKVIEEVSTKDEALTPGFAMYVKKAFAKENIDPAVLGCYLNLCTPDENELKANIHRYMANIRFASILGAGVVGTETGAPNTAYSFEPACHSEEALKFFIKNLKTVVKYAEQFGVILAIEPVFKHTACNPKRARQVLDEVASDNLQIIFDPVNLLDISNYQQRDEIFAETIELIGKEVAVMHIKDFIVKDGDLVSCAAGTGEMDYTQILSWLKKEKPYIHATLEDTVPANAVQAREYIQGLWDRL